MPVSERHNKPLFHEKTLARAMEGFAWPPDLDEKRAVVDKWVQTYRRGTLDAVKETSLHGEFLGDIFGQVLGYTSVVQGEGDTWTLHAEQTISDHGGTADGALGLFSATETLRGKPKLIGRVVAPIELKGAKINLDRRPTGRVESPVEQGWRYANHKSRQLPGRLLGAGPGSLHRGGEKAAAKILRRAQPRGRGRAQGCLRRLRHALAGPPGRGGRAGAPGSGPGEPSLRPHARGGRPHVAHRPAQDALHA